MLPAASKRQEMMERARATILAAQDPRGGFLASNAADRYPFVYPRDCAFVCRALLADGAVEPVRRCLDYLVSVQDPSGEWLQRYEPSGKPAPSRSLETDSTGLVLTALRAYAKERADPGWAEQTWPTVERAASFLISKIDPSGLIVSEHSVHEYGGTEAGHEIWANSWAARGLEDAAALAELFGHGDAAPGWDRAGSQLRAALLSRFWDSKGEFFVKNCSADQRVRLAPDVSVLAPALSGLLVSSDPRVVATLERVEAALWDPLLGGFVRFRHWDAVRDWHWYDGGHGPWPLWTLLIARVARAAGRQELADRCEAWVLDLARRGALPEHIAKVDDFRKWSRSDPDVQPHVIRARARAQEAQFFWRFEGSGNAVVPWVTPLIWANAELLRLLTTPREKENLA